MNIHQRFWMEKRQFKYPIFSADRLQEFSLFWVNKNVTRISFLSFPEGRLVPLKTKFASLHILKGIDKLWALKWLLDMLLICRCDSSKSAPKCGCRWLHGAQKIDIKVGWDLGQLYGNYSICECNHNKQQWIVNLYVDQLGLGWSQ